MHDDIENNGESVAEDESHLLEDVKSNEFKKVVKNLATIRDELISTRPALEYMSQLADKSENMRSLLLKTKYPETIDDIRLLVHTVHSNAMTVRMYMFVVQHVRISSHTRMSQIPLSDPLECLVCQEEQVGFFYKMKPSCALHNLCLKNRASGKSCVCMLKCWWHILCEDCLCRWMLEQ